MKLTNHLRRHYFSLTGGPAPEIHSKCSTRYNNYSTITKTINQSPQSKFKCTISILSLGYFTWLTFCWSRVVREEQKTKRVVRIKSHNTISHISSILIAPLVVIPFNLFLSLSLSPCGSLCLWFVICLVVKCKKDTTTHSSASCDRGTLIVKQMTFMFNFFSPLSYSTSWKRGPNKQNTH